MHSFVEAKAVFFVKVICIVKEKNMPTPMENNKAGASAVAVH